MDHPFEWQRLLPPASVPGQDLRHAIEEGANELKVHGDEPPADNPSPTAPSLPFMYASTPAEVHVGLGGFDTVEVEVVWPDVVSRLGIVDTRQILDVTRVR